MERTRRVRIRYPNSIVELAVALSCAFDKQRIASSLSLPRSSVYRWTAQARTSHDTAVSRDLGRLVDACESDGISVREAVLRLLPETSPEREAIVRCVRADVNAFVDAPAQIVPAGAPFAGGDSRDSVLRAKWTIDSRFREPLSCASLARSVGMCKFSFIRAFTLAFAVSPYRYLLSVRVHHAKQLLPRTDRPLHDIAASVGFGSASSMQRAFRKLTGRSPANFSGHALRPAAEAANAADWSVRVVAT